MKFSRAPLFLFLTILLASCGNAVTATPNVTAAAPSKMTATSAPTTTPLPTETLTPSPTPDPNAPEEWKADANHYTKVIKGETVYFMKENGVEKQWMIITDSNGVEQFKDWVVNKIPKGDTPDGKIYLVRPFGYNPNFSLPFQYFSTEENAPEMRRNTNYPEGADGTFTAQVSTALSKRLNQNHLERDKILGAGGDVSLPTLDSEGKTHNFSIRDGEIRVIWVDDVSNPDIVNKSSG